MVLIPFVRTWGIIPKD